MGWEKNECWRLTLTKQRGDFGTSFVPDKGGGGETPEALSTVRCQVVQEEHIGHGRKFCPATCVHCH